MAERQGAKYAKARQELRVGVAVLKERAIFCNFL